LIVKINAFLSSKNYRFAIAVKEVLLKFCVRNFSNISYLFIL